MSSAAFDILALVETFNPVRKTDTRTRFELLAQRVLRYSFTCGLALFGIALLFLAWHQLLSPLSALAFDILRLVTRAVFFVLFLCFGALVAEVACWYMAIRQSLWRGFVAELEWDLDQARQLDRFDKKDLKRAHEFLELRINRARERIKSFVGGTDKLALVVMLAGAWALYKEVPWRSALALFHWNDPAQFPNIALVFLFMFCMTTIAGALIVNANVQRYAYQLDVLKLHLSTRD
jgi:hypothetical protein